MAEYKELSPALFQKFQNIVGKENANQKFEIRWTYAFGGTSFNRKWIPDAIILPKNAKQVSKVIKLANEEFIPLTVRGSGTSLSGGTMTPYRGIIVDLSRMNRILDIDIDNNMVELEPGVICDSLNEELKNHGYFFPPDPGSSSVATVGGMVATNAGGIQAFKYGVTKQYIISLEVVLPTGSIVKLGTDVLKSVSTYNLKDLLIGSEGTLGIITKIRLRIRPLPEARKLGLFIFDSAEQIQEAVIEIRNQGIMPNLIEFMGRKVLKAVREYLGGDFLDFPDGYTLLAEIDGQSEQEVEKMFSKMNEIILKKNPIFSKIAKNLEERDHLIQARKANLPAVSRIQPTVCVEDCTIRIEDFAETIKKIEKIPEQIGAKHLETAVICHMEGNLHPKFIFNENNPEDLIEFEKAMDYLYKKIILPIGGTLTGEHGIGKIKTPYLALEHGNEVVNIMHKIKKLFDPHMILNPGIGKADDRPLNNTLPERNLKNQSNKILELNCMRCGFCNQTCPSLLHYRIEAYSPRGRLSILNGLVHGDLTLTPLIIDILHTCTLCGLCKVKCPAGVSTYEIFEKAREIVHKR